MAYISQDDKASLAPGIKAVLKKYNMKGTIGVRDHSVLVVNIQSGAIDFGKDRCEVNRHSIDQTYSGTAREFLNELVTAMKGNKWFDRSDRMVDYFEVAFYLSINVGSWQKPYACTGSLVTA
jgi:hypothetical protein